MRSYVKSPAADIDLIEIWSCVSQNSFESADTLLDRFEEVFTLLVERPFVGRAREELAADLRSFLVSNYLIFYRLSEDVVEIVRVLNAARDIEATLNNP